jgi:two-component system cell cycle response regulator DivK
MFSFGSVTEMLAHLSDPVDLVLLDLELGEEDGVGMLPRLRADVRFATAIIAAMTANVLPQDVKKARQVGFNGFLGKPLNFERFPDQLQQLLNGQSVWYTR